MIITKAIKYLGNDGNFNWINTSEITSLSALFKGNKDFNGDITKWDVSNIESINWTFYGCASFKRDLSNWNMPNLKYMISAFAGSKYPYPEIVKKWMKSPKVISSTGAI